MAKLLLYDVIVHIHIHSILDKKKNNAYYHNQNSTNRDGKKI